MKDLKEILQYYLHTGVKVKNTIERPCILSIENYYLAINCEWKPLLLPMSSLAEPLEDGSIPIIELAKIGESQHFSAPNFFEYNKKANISICYFHSKETDELIAFSYIHDQNAFYLRSEFRTDFLVIVNQIQLFQYLFKHHFDVFGLIEQGLAISVHEAQS